MPPAQITVFAAIVSIPAPDSIVKPVSVHILNDYAALHLNAQLDKRTGSFFRKVLRKTHQHTRSPIQQDDFCFFRMDRTKVILECFSGDLGNRARQFHASRPSTNDDEGKPCTAHRWISDTLGYFECVQNLVSDRGRFLNALQARGPLAPIRCARNRMSASRQRRSMNRNQEWRRLPESHASNQDLHPQHVPSNTHVFFWRLKTERRGACNFAR